MEFLPDISDVLILGGSHAGLSAALTLYRALHTCIIFDTHQPRNRWDTPVHIMPTWDDESAEEKRSSSRAELQKCGLVHFIDFGVETVSQTLDGLFHVTDSQGEKWLGRKLLLAVGSTDIFPHMDGYEKNFGRGIFPCMLQFGYEQRGVASAGLLAIDTLASASLASMLAQDTYKFTDQLTLYTSMNPKLAFELRTQLEPHGIDVDDRSIHRLIPGPNKCEVTIEFSNGQKKVEGFLVHKPGSKVTSKLVDQLGLGRTESGDIKTFPPFCQTTRPGVYAAGDCASMMKIIPNAISMGAYAGAGIARELPKTVKRQGMV